MFRLNKLTFIVNVAIAMFLLSGCATMFKTVKIELWQSPSDLQVSCNGQNLPVSVAIAGSDYNNVYYKKVVKIPRSKQDQILTLQSGTKKTDIQLKSKFATGTLMADIFNPLFPVTVIIDGVKGPLRTFEPKIIMVSSELDKK